MAICQTLGLSSGTGIDDAKQREQNNDALLSVFFFVFGLFKVICALPVEAPRAIL